MTKVAVHIKWIPCPFAEAMLQELRTEDGNQLVFSLVTVPLNSIKQTASALQNSRFSGISQEHVDKIVIAMESGKPLPPPVLTADKEVLAGNHRIQAAKEYGATDLLAYVVRNADQKVKELIRRSDNVGHGLGLKHEEIIHQARYLLRMGLPMELVSKRMGIRIELLREHQRSEKVAEKLERRGVNVAPIVHTSLLILSELDASPKVQEEIGRLLACRPLSCDQVRSLVNVVKQEQTPEDQMMRFNESKTKIMAQSRVAKNNLGNKFRSAFLADDSLYRKVMYGKRGAPMDMDDIGFVSDEEFRMIAKNVSHLNDLLQAGLREKGLKKLR